MKVVVRASRTMEDGAWCEVCGWEVVVASRIGSRSYPATVAASRHTAATGHRTSLDRHTLVRVEPAENVVPARRP